MLEFLLAAGLAASVLQLLRSIWQQRNQIKKKLKELWEAIKRLLPKRPVEGPVDNPAEIPPPELRKLQQGDTDLLVKFLMQSRGIGEAHARELIEKLIKSIYEMDLPIFKIARKRLEEARKKIPVKRFRTKIRKVPKVVEGTRVERDIAITQRPSPTMEDDFDVVPMDSISHLSRIMRKSQIALPPELLVNKMRNGEVSMKQYVEEVREVKERTVPTKETITVDEPYQEAYTEMVEIQQEPQSQILYILLDCSGSMSEFDRMVIACAVAISVIRYGMDNKSEFYQRNFTDGVDTEQFAGTKHQKLRLMARIIQKSYADGGTDIANAIAEAGKTIKRQKKADRAEILLITDGEDFIPNEWLRSYLGNDILLHSVKLGQRSNESLQANSTTYVRLSDSIEDLTFERSW